MNAITTQGLTKRYGADDGVHGLDLTVPRGSTFGLLGPNGAGKSTTLKMLMGLIAPDEGHAEVLGVSPPFGDVPLRARIGYVPERHCMYRWMTVSEIVRFVSAFYPTWNASFCDALLRQYGLDLGKKVEQLSHGMQTKLALTLALAHEPELLLLDEPTTGLDPIVREEFLEGILHPLVAESERTVIFSSHIMSDIETVADTIAIVNRGRLLTCRSRDDLANGIKRIVTAGADIPPFPVIHSEPQSDSTALIVDEFDSARYAAWSGATTATVHDMTLEDTFKAFVKGDRVST